MSYQLYLAMRMIHDSELSFLASEQSFVAQIIIVGQTRGVVGQAAKFSARMIKMKIYSLQTLLFYLEP